MMLQIQAVGRDHHPRRMHPLLQQVLADGFRHRHARRDAVGPQAVERRVAHQTLLVRNARDPEATGRDHPIDVRLDAVAKMDQRRTRLAERLLQQAGTRQRVFDEVAHRTDGSPHGRPGAGPAIRQTVRDRARQLGNAFEHDDVAAGAGQGRRDVFRFVDQERGIEAAAVDATNQVQQSGQRSPDMAGFAALDEKNSLPHADPTLYMGRYRGISSCGTRRQSVDSGHMPRPSV